MTIIRYDPELSKMTSLLLLLQLDLIWIRILIDDQNSTQGNYSLSYNRVASISNNPEPTCDARGRV